MKRPTNISLSKPKEIKIQEQPKSRIVYSEEIDKGQITLSDIHYKKNKQPFKIEMVYKRPSFSNKDKSFDEYFDLYTKEQFENRTGCKIDSVFKIEIKKKVGTESKADGYSIGIKSEEKRDSKTGKYD